MNEHEQYWSIGEPERQRMLKEHYNLRDAGHPYATSRDGNQRELEITAIQKALQAITPGRLVDLGCGNGYTLIQIGKHLPGWEFDGIDFSEALIDGASRLLGAAQGELHTTPTFHCGDAIAFVESLADASVDVVLTERFLLNLPSQTAQMQMLKDVARVLKPGGHLLMCEASVDGLNELNRLRVGMGLAAIQETSQDNLSAIRFDDHAIEDFVRSIGFDLVSKEGFSLFFAISRVLHPALVSPDQPKFDALINDLARRIQELLPLTPGIGSNVLWVLKKAV